MVSVDVLHDIVWEGINEVPFSPKSRCHEAARTIATQLKARGFSVEVKDGFVDYDAYSLLVSESRHFSFSEEEREEFLKAQEQKVRGRFRIEHSWCEVTEGERVVVVDFHFSLAVSSGNTFTYFLIVEEQAKLPHVYNPTRKVLGNWLVIRAGRLPSVTRLRLGGAT